MRSRVIGTLIGGICAALLAGSTAPAFAHVPTARPAVIGGQPTTIEQSPWQVLVLPGPTALCGGALIAANWVVTAAHCVQGVDPAAIEVHAGITTVGERSADTRLPVSAVFLHPGLNTSTYANDVALLQLTQAWAPAANRQVIMLPVGQDPAFPAAGAPASITGWGQTSETGSGAQQLQAAGVTVLADRAGSCGQYGGAYNGSAHICAGVVGGAVDTCNGDSGGPLVVDVNGMRTLAGITSVGNGCARADYPGLYTRMTTVLPWIQSVADIPTGAPNAPTAVTAKALANGRAAVSWQPTPGAGAAGLTTFTVMTSPGGATCSTTETWCTIEGLAPGRPVTFTVQASDVAGSSGASQPSTPMTAVHRTKAVGSAMALSTVRSAAKVRSGVVRSLTPAICTASTKSVRMRSAGLCTLSVGSKRRVYIAVS